MAIRRAHQKIGLRGELTFNRTGRLRIRSAGADGTTKASSGDIKQTPLGELLVVRRRLE